MACGSVEVGGRPYGWLGLTSSKEHDARGEHSIGHCGGEGGSGSKEVPLVREKGGKQVGNSDRTQGKWGPHFHHFIQEAASQPTKAWGETSRTPCSEVG